MTDSETGRGRERLRQHREVDQRLPAALEQAGRAEELVHGEDVPASGARADHRHSVPGTMIPGGPRPAASAGEWERIEEATRGARPRERD
jgi:hypothetical protein